MPANSPSEIPLIDIGPYFGGSHADRKRVADEMSRACEHIGFFLVSGHGVDPALIEGVQRESKAFFGLPLKEKLEIKQRKEEKGSLSRSAASAVVLKERTRLCVTSARINPDAQSTPGQRGTITREMPSLLASVPACSGPAPPPTSSV